MRFTKSITFDALPEVVAEMLADPAFRERVASMAGATAYDVSVIETDSGVHAVLESRQPSVGLPGFARRFVGDELVIHQEEHWHTATDGTMSVAIPGKPGKVTGAIALAGAGVSTVQTVTADISVGLPLVGGRIERMIGQILGNVLKLQARVGNAWLAGER